MDINLLKGITIGKLAEAYKDDGQGGVKGLNGKLDIRPPYQREFIYGEKESNAVIRTITNDYPIGIMYWADRPDGTYEVIDGQQRAISICQYIVGDVRYDGNTFENIHHAKQKQILEYTLPVYVCDGDDKHKMEWFETINIAGMALSSQEIRNAIYHGSFVSDAKIYFSKANCVASNYSKRLSGMRKRQHYLETAIKWAVNSNKKDAIIDYMAVHQKDESAKPLWKHFRSVMKWTEKIFPNDHAKTMQGVDWGRLYTKYKKTDYDIEYLKNRISDLMKDDDVTQKSGIYEFLLEGETGHARRHLELRAFTNSQKITKYEKQNKKCAICDKKRIIEEMEADHIIPWSKGGLTELNNLQMVCQECNRHKGNK